MMVGNALLTTAIVFLSKDTSVGSDGTLKDARTGRPVKTDNSEVRLATDGTLVGRDNGAVVQTATKLYETALDSRLPEAVWTELKYAQFRSLGGGSLHVFIQAVSRVVDDDALYGSYVHLHTSIGRISLDGPIVTFTDGMEGVFKEAGFTVVHKQRRLQGIFELIGLFNSVPSFEMWNSTSDLPPKIPTTFQAEADLLYACDMGDEDLCQEGRVESSSIVTEDGASHARVKVQMWADAAAGLVRERFTELANLDGWAYETLKHTSTSTIDMAQVWNATGENYFCRTRVDPMAGQLGPFGSSSPDQLASSYKGVVQYNGVDVERFIVKHREVEHIIVEYLLVRIGQTDDETLMAPRKFKMTIGKGKATPRVISYVFNSFDVLPSVEPDVFKWYERSSSAAAGEGEGETATLPFNETACASTLPYTSTKKIPTAATIYGTSPFTPLSSSPVGTDFVWDLKWEPNTTAAEWANKRTPSERAPSTPAAPPSSSPASPPAPPGRRRASEQAPRAAPRDASDIVATFEREVAALGAKKVHARVARDGSLAAVTSGWPATGAVTKARAAAAKYATLMNASMLHRRALHHTPNHGTAYCPDCAFVNPLTGELDVTQCDWYVVQQIRQALSAPPPPPPSTSSNEEEESALPCEISVSLPLGCSGSIECNAEATINPFVTVSFGGSISWDFTLPIFYAAHAAAIAAAAAERASGLPVTFDDTMLNQFRIEANGCLSIGVTVGIPKCDWCPPLLEVQLSICFTAQQVECAAADGGGFSEVIFSVGLDFTILIVGGSLTVNLYDHPGADDSWCPDERSNWVANANHATTVEGSLQICLIWCFDIYNGHLVPYVPVDNDAYWAERRANNYGRGCWDQCHQTTGHCKFCENGLGSCCRANHGDWAPECVGEGPWWEHKCSSTNLECLQRCGAEFDMNNYLPSGSYYVKNIGRNKFCHGYSNGNGLMWCDGANEAANPDYNEFEVDQLSQDRTILKGERAGSFSHGTYCADDDSRQMECNRGRAAGWEKFDLERRTEYGMDRLVFSLRGVNNWRYCRADDQTGSLAHRIRCDQGSADSSITHFEFIRSGVAYGNAGDQSADVAAFYQRGVNRESCIRNNRDVC